MAARDPEPGMSAAGQPPRPEPELHRIPLAVLGELASPP